MGIRLQIMFTLNKWNTLAGREKESIKNKKLFRINKKGKDKNYSKGKFFK